MRWQQYNRRVTALLYLPELVEHFHIDVDLLEDIFESFVTSPSHRSNHSRFDFANQVLYKTLSLNSCI